MSRPTNPGNGEHQGSLRRLQLVMDTNDSDLTPDEISRLFQVAALEQQTIAEMDACWERLRASHRAKERLQHLTPSEVRDAIARSRQALGEDGES
jgi:hypothetical protein